MQGRKQPVTYQGEVCCLGRELGEAVSVVSPGVQVSVSSLTRAHAFGNCVPGCGLIITSEGQTWVSPYRYIVVEKSTVEKLVALLFLMICH